METKQIPVFSGYELHALSIFQNLLDDLTKEVETLQAKDPIYFYDHPSTKLLLAVLCNITQTVPSNPDHADFRQGLTLGKKHTSWRRVKKKEFTSKISVVFSI